MSCEKLESLLIGYLGGRLPAVDRAAVEQHVASCAGCSARLEGFRAVFLALDAWEAPEVSLWFDARLRQRIAAGEAARGRWGLSGLRALMRPAYALAMAAILLVGTLVVWNRRPAAHPGLAQKTTVSKATAVEAQRLDEIMPVVDDYDILANFDVLAELKPAKSAAKNKL